MSYKKPWSDFLASINKPENELLGTHLLCLLTAKDNFENHSSVTMQDCMVNLTSSDSQVTVCITPTLNITNKEQVFHYEITEVDLGKLMTEQYVKPNHELLGDVLTFLALGKAAFDNRPRGGDLNNYIIWFTSSEQYISISFIPIIDTYVHDIPFQIPYRGMYKYGAGYSFVYDATSCELLDTKGMR